MSARAAISKLAVGLRSRGVALRSLYFLYYGSGACWSPFFTVYLRQVGLSGLQVGTLAGMRPAVVLLSQPLWGLVADMHGRRRTLLVTISLASLLILGFAGSGAYWFLLGWALLFALLTSPVGSLIDSLVLDHLEERRSASFGSLRLWGAAGWAVAALIAGRLLAGRDLRLIFPLAGAIMGLGWLVAWRRTREPAATGLTKRDWRGVGNLLRNRRLMTFLGLVVLLQVGAAAVMTFHSVYLSDLGASRELIGLAYTLQGLSEIPLYLASAALIRRFGPRRTLVLTFLVFAGRMLLYSLIRVPIVAVAVEACHGFSFSLFLVASVDYVNRQVPAEWRATGQSLLSAAYFGAGGLAGNAWAGFLYDWLGVQMMFRVNGCLALGVALLALVLLREAQRPAGTAAELGR